jgi:hypothetical protein
VSIDDQIKCVAREIALRRTCYPRWVMNGKMKDAQALWELAAMEAVLETLKSTNEQRR